MRYKTTLEETLAALRTGNSPRGRALIGFDGYIDRLVRLQKSQREPPEYFESISDFSAFLQSYPGKSMDITVRRTSEKIGGNGPIMAESLAVKDVKTRCVGAFGYPETIDVFKPLQNICSLVSLEQAAFTLALEFTDSKLMLGETESFNRIDWERITSVMGEKDFFSGINESDIIGFTNWSGMPKSNSILKGLLQFDTNKQPLSGRMEGKKKILFIDPADPSCKTEEQFAEFFTLIKQLSGIFNITLGINAKETVLVYNRFFQCREDVYSDALAQKLAEEMPVSEIVVHGTDWALALEKGNECQRIKGTRIPNPLVLTGAGDNFNAGYCLGKLCSLNRAACLLLGNISASLYIQNGFPAGISGLTAYIENIILEERYEHL